MSKQGVFHTKSPPTSHFSPRLDKLLREIAAYTEGCSEVEKLEPVEIQYDDPIRQTLFEIALEVRRVRNLRTKFLPKHYFGEIAWDILIELYLDQRKARSSMTILASRLLTPMTTVLRWLSLLEGEGRIYKLNHPTDRRVHFWELTELGRRAMDSYFSEFLHSSRFEANL